MDLPGRCPTGGTHDGRRRAGDCGWRAPVAARGRLSVTVDPDLAGLAARTVAAIGAAADRGVLVTAILHRDPKNRSALLRGWPKGRDAPGIFTWPQRDDEMASLHAKVLVADARDALVTSANLTYHGFEGNVEVGVRVTGDAADQLEAVFHELIRVRDFAPWTDAPD